MYLRFGSQPIRPELTTEGLRWDDKSEIVINLLNKKCELINILQPFPGGEDLVEGLVHFMTIGSTVGNKSNDGFNIAVTNENSFVVATSIRSHYMHNI